MSEKRIAELEAFLRCTEEWAQFWEKRFIESERGGETYEIPLPLSLRGSDA